MMGSILHEQRRSVRTNGVTREKGGDISDQERLRECPLTVLSKYERVHLLFRPSPD